MTPSLLKHTLAELEIKLRREADEKIDPRYLRGQIDGIRLAQRTIEILAISLGENE